jgi:hypothetical protein
MAKTHLGLPLRARTKVVGKSSAVRDGPRLGDDGRRLVIENKDKKHKKHEKKEKKEKKEKSEEGEASQVDQE